MYEEQKLSLYDLWEKAKRTVLECWLKIREYIQKVGRSIRIAVKVTMRNIAKELTKDDVYKVHARIYLRTKNRRIKKKQLKILLGAFLGRGE